MTNGRESFIMAACRISKQGESSDLFRGWEVPFMLRWGAHRVRSWIGLVDRLHVMLNFFVWLAVSRLIMFLLCCLDCSCRKKSPAGRPVASQRGIVLVTARGEA